MSKRLVTFFLTLVICLVWVIPAATPDRSVASAQTLANGLVVAGDFKGAGYTQIASLFDASDTLGLRISVLDRSTAATPTPAPSAPPGPTPIPTREPDTRSLADAGDAFTASVWFTSADNTFDLGRMKVAAADVDFDGKTDIVALYDDGGTSVRVLVWKSTGTGFVFQGPQGWWSSPDYAWNRVKAIVPGNFSATGHNGLLFIYQYDSFDMHIHYFESDGKQLLFGGVQGVYASGVGQYDTARARFAVGHFTRRTGPDQLASVYQYPSFKIRIHVFDPTPNGLQPVNGWTGVWESAEGTYDITKAKFAAADVDGDGLTDLLSFYWYGDGSVRVHAFLAANSLALVDTNGIAQFAPFTMPWLQTQVAAGDWNKDGKGDLATLTSLDDGSTHVGVLRSTGTALQWSANQWVTPTAELAASAACTECWPLNGMPASGPALQRRTLAVKIDNAPTGRPHHGISKADIVVELLVEGFITRLAAYFHSQDADEVGAVRSVRFSDRYTTPMVRGVLVFSGGSQLMMDLVYADMANGNYVGVSPQLGQGNAFYRTNVDGKVVPHNLFTSTSALRAAANTVGGGGAVDVPRWGFLRSFDHLPTAGGFLGSRPASTLTIPYRADAVVRYDYDPVSHTYARYQSDGRTFQREVDGANNVAIAARNVVVINTDVWATEVHDDAGGAASLDMRLTGVGRASFFRDGRRQEGSWYRASWFDQFTFVTDTGERILLSPGQTWIHILPTDWVVPSA